MNFLFRLLQEIQSQMSDFEVNDEVKLLELVLSFLS